MFEVVLDGTDAIGASAATAAPGGDAFEERGKRPAGTVAPRSTTVLPPGQDRVHRDPPNMHLDFRQQQSGQRQECAR
jgi:hypothetical protein